MLDEVGSDEVAGLESVADEEDKARMARVDNEGLPEIDGLGADRVEPLESLS